MPLRNVCTGALVFGVVLGRDEIAAVLFQGSFARRRHVDRKQYWFSWVSRSFQG